MTKKIFSGARVRFAPSPTGWMHLGNARTALLNYLFAKKYSGTFVLRIEDTDQTRNIDPRGKRILEDLAWLGLTIDEGPSYQSERNDIYQKYLTVFIEKNYVYRCFESNEELEQKRQRQLALGLPPKYDRAGLKLSQAEIEKNLSEGKSFIWRLKLPEGSVTIKDIAHGAMTFDLSNFSDIALTRHDGTCTFLFANCVDDIEMQITHVLRGGDHLTNTAVQGVMYDLFEVPQPTFYHLPLICNAEGKKISKREFGASLDDYKKSGFLPEAVCNYLAIIGGSFANEIMNLDELAQAVHFDESSPKGTVHFDLEKLRWINHKWIGRLTTREIAERALPLVQNAYQEKNITIDTLAPLIEPIRNDLVTLDDVVTMLSFFFTRPIITKNILSEYKGEMYQEIFEVALKNAKDSMSILNTLKKLCKEQQKPISGAFILVRIALTGSPDGISIGDLFTMLEFNEILDRMAILAK